MKAILYTSEAGHTRAFAELLSKETGLPIVQAGKELLPKDSEILYMGWLFAGKIKGYAAAAKRYKLAGVIGVGMSPPSDELVKKLREQNKIPCETKLFYLRGGFDFKKVHGMNRFLMRLVGFKIRRQIKKDKGKLSEEQRFTLRMLSEGASDVGLSQLRSVIEWYINSNKC